MGTHESHCVEKDSQGCKGTAEEEAPTTKRMKTTDELDCDKKLKSAKALKTKLREAESDAQNILQALNTETTWQEFKPMSTQLNNALGELAAVKGKYNTSRTFCTTSSTTGHWG